MSFVHPLVVGFLVALGVGLLIGIDRERNKGDGATRHPAGLRTFTLASLLGATAMAVGAWPRCDVAISINPLARTPSANIDAAAMIEITWA